MYVCMYVYVCICMYVCMYVCTYVCMYVCRSGVSTAVSAVSGSVALDEAGVPDDQDVTEQGVEGVRSTLASTHQLPEVGIQTVYIRM